MPRRKYHEWMNVPGFPDYLINKYGEVKSKRTLTIMKIHTKDDNPTPYVNLIPDRKTKSKTVRVALLVAQAFVPNIHGFTKIRYKDGDPGNVKASNLEWSRTSKVWVPEKRNPWAFDKWVDVLRWRTQGATYQEIADQFNLPVSRVSKACHTHLDKYRVQAETDEYLIRWYYKATPIDGSWLPEGYRLVSNLTDRSLGIE